MNAKLRIGAVEFLNGRPLVFGLADRLDVTLVLAPPSQLPDLLRSGRVDVALAPAIEYFRLAAEGAERIRASAGGGSRPGYVVLDVAAIGSRGPIGSVRLFGFSDQDRLRRVLLDPASRTSNTVARILVARRYKCSPHFVMPDEAGRAASRAPDAELVIGDRALTARRPGALWVADLGQEWESFIHLPLVYALWVARADAPLDRIAAVLTEARDRGLAARQTIADHAADQLGLSRDASREYLVRQVRYQFGPKEQEGLRALHRLAAEEGLAPDGVRLRVYRTGHAAAEGGAQAAPAQ